ncbi:hypothetical protein [Paraburkholderia phosphatilytica]|jgi:hypothetical protein|uniref:hypothetical protein n=1 Tax=Paraburkholderia phosphatilytica TaxID=2282883 RepID=UPI000E4688FA|nr:hypothetical protein [Paraburkholderia phosphatilytica]
MKKASLALLVSLTALTGAAYAQTDEGGVTMSTDPAKAADVEQRAQALQSQQSSMENMPMQHHEHHPMKHKAHKMMKKAAPADAASQ